MIWFMIKFYLKKYWVELALLIYSALMLLFAIMAGGVGWLYGFTLGLVALALEIFTRKK